MKASEIIVIDLTKSFANIGVAEKFCGTFALDSALLPYPDAILKDVYVEFDVTFLNPNVEVEGKIVCRIEGRCDRCATEVGKTETLPFKQTFFKDFAEEGCYAYSGSKLDVTKAVCDEIVLSLPTLLLCSPDCKGICPVCGTNRNQADCDCDVEKQNVFSQLKDLII